MQRRDPKYSAILPPSGGYEKLKSYQVAKLLYAVTVRFVDRYIPKGSRTKDQMEQAARSGERNPGSGPGAGEPKAARSALPPRNWN